jgi:cytochrome c oxidase subunit 3
LAYITWGHHALILNNRKAVITGTFFTIILAIVFTYLQYVEYTESGFSFADSVYGSVFYATTGLHGLHVLVGTLFILVQYLRIVNYQVTTTHHLGHESAILYWQNSI